VIRRCSSQRRFDRPSVDRCTQRTKLSQTINKIRLINFLNSQINPLKCSQKIMKGIIQPLEAAKFQL
jgi:hypothetical protein